MIDTIALTLKMNTFKILEPDRFTPSASNLLDTSYKLGGRANSWCVQNPSPRELKSGIYKPRLTLTRRMNRQHISEITLKVEFSLPKLLFNNNFDEVENNDFYEIVVILAQKLKDMGIEVTEFDLISSLVSVVHYSKNIPLTDGSTPYMYLKEIQKSNISQRLDFNQTDFRNEGHSVKFRTNTFEIAFYDKIKELEKGKISKKRTEEDNTIQMNLFEKMSVRKPFELLRIEIRLNQRQKIKQVLKLISLNMEPTFGNLFSKSVSQKVLLYYLDQVENNYPKTLAFTPRSHKDFIAQFRIDNPQAQMKDSLTALGLHHILEEIGTRETRELLEKNSAPSWYSLIKKMNGFVYPKGKFFPFKVIRDSIEEFKPVKLVDFEDRMLNNDKYK